VMNWFCGANRCCCYIPRFFAEEIMRGQYIRRIVDTVLTYPMLSLQGYYADAFSFSEGRKIMVRSFAVWPSSAALLRNTLTQGYLIG
jgi:hypothetical protein